MQSDPSHQDHGNGSLFIRADRVVTSTGVIEDGVVLVEDGRISAVDRRQQLTERGAVLRGAVLMPGFIDLHWHGYGGRGLRRADEVREAVRAVAAGGVTTCYAGLGAGSTISGIAENVATVAAVVGADTGGARLAGVFMEGPFISVEKHGAWNPANLRTPDVGEMRRLIAASEHRIRRFNVASELSGGLEFIRAAREQGVVVSLGHSNATYEQALEGIAAGATITNHTYNAMSGLEHRAPGLAGATLTNDALLAELILDGVHVHPAAARALYRARGAAGVALITDSSLLAGMPDGRYDWGGRVVIIHAGTCRLENGTIAGSVSTLDQDVRNARAWLTQDLVELAAMSAHNAARAMGIDGHTGSIAPGKDADLVLLDEELRVLATVVGGTVVYRHEGVTGSGERGAGNGGERRPGV